MVGLQGFFCFIQRCLPFTLQLDFKKITRNQKTHKLLKFFVYNIKSHGT